MYPQIIMSTSNNSQAITGSFSLQKVMEQHQTQQYPTPTQRPKHTNQSSFEEFEPLSFTKFYEMATVSPNTPVNGWIWDNTSGKPDRQNYESKNSKVKPFTTTNASISKWQARQTVTTTPNSYHYNYESNVSRGDQSIATIAPTGHLKEHLE